MAVGLERASDDTLKDHAYIISFAAIQGVAWTLLAVSVLLTIGRLFIRWQRLRRLGLDDFFNALAALLVIPFVVVCIVYLPVEYNAQLYFLRLRNDAPSKDEFVFSYRMELVALLHFWLIIYTVKASFLALYWHIFAVSPRYRIVWWMTTIFIAVSFGITWLSVFWHCGSPSKLGNLEACEGLPETTAITLISLWCALNVIGGIILMVVPIVMVTSRLLTLEKPQRLGLIFVFGLVLIDIAFDIVRTVYALDSRLATTTNLMAVWTISEPTIAVIVCALPHYKCLLSPQGRRLSTIDSMSSFSKVDSMQRISIRAGTDNASVYSFENRGYMNARA